MNGNEPRWLWTETAEFAAYCYDILPDADISEVDGLRMAIHDTVVFRPEEAPLVYPVGHLNHDPMLRWFTVLDSAHWEFPISVVVFRIDREPTADSPGEVTGRAVWTLETLRAAGRAPY